MKKTALTYNILKRFEGLVNPDTLNSTQIEQVENYAYCAAMVPCSNPNIKEWDWFAGLVKERLGIDLEVLETTLEITTACKGIETQLEARKDRSAWDKGVTLYAFDLLEILEDRAKQENHMPKTLAEFKKYLLNGATDWRNFSWGGCSLIYNNDIAERLCTPSELKKTHNGENRPNRNEEWLDVQARALYWASIRLQSLYQKYIKNN